MSSSLDEQSNSVEVPSAVCAACGQEFPCCAAAASESELSTCWCFKVQLDAASLAKLQDRFKGCLCEKCLTKWADFPSE